MTRIDEIREMMNFPQIAPPPLAKVISACSYLLREAASLNERTEAAEAENQRLAKENARLQGWANCGGVSLGLKCSSELEWGHEIFGPYHDDGQGGCICEFHWFKQRLEAAEADLEKARKERDSEHDRAERANDLIAAAERRLAQVIGIGNLLIKAALVMRCCADLREPPDSEECKQMGDAMRTWEAALTSPGPEGQPQKPITIVDFTCDDGEPGTPTGGSE